MKAAEEFLENNHSLSSYEYAEFRGDRLADLMEKYHQEKLKNVNVEVVSDDAINEKCWNDAYYLQSCEEDHMETYERLINERKEMKKKLIELPIELFNKIVELADKEGRSVNKQIRHLLEKALKIK